MTTAREAEFAIYISGINHDDAVDLCGRKFAEAVNNWYADDDDDDCNTGGAGNISIPVADIREAMTLFKEVEEAKNWVAEDDNWQVELRATRIMSNYSLVATLTETGCDLQMRPCGPVSATVDELLKKMQTIINDLKVACMSQEVKP